MKAGPSLAYAIGMTPHAIASAITSEKLSSRDVTRSSEARAYQEERSSTGSWISVRLRPTSSMSCRRRSSELPPTIARDQPSSSSREAAIARIACSKFLSGLEMADRDDQLLSLRG